MKKKTWIFCIVAMVSVVILLFFMIVGKRNRVKFSPIPIYRYDVALMQIDTLHVGDELHRLYGDFELFLDGVDLDDRFNHRYFLDFVTDSFSNILYDAVLEKYPNLNQLEKTFGKSFALYNQLFQRHKKQPEIYTYLSKLDYHNRVIFQDSVLVIGLDLYLGADYPYYDYNSEDLPMYIRERLDSRFIAVDAMRAAAHYELDQTPQTVETFLDQIVLYGKVAYFLEKTLPDVDMATRLGYTKEQLAWCKKSEAMMWAYFVGMRILYEQDPFKYRKFILESPTVQVFPGSPGRVGYFSGYRIVKDYMNNTGQTLPELFTEKDAQKILKLSNYRP